MVERRTSDCVVVDYSSYGYPDRDKSPNGVNDLVQESIPYLKAKGYEVILVGPSIPKEESTADYTLGKAKRIPRILARKYHTSFPIPRHYKKHKAKELLSELRPGIIVMDEPFNGLGAHTIMSGVPKRDDGKPIPVTIARFHAPLTNWDILPEMILRAGKIRWLLPRFNKSSVLTIERTEGPVNTITNNIDGAIAVSEATKRGVNKHYGIDCNVIYNGINTDEFTPEGQLKEGLNDDGKETILMPGRNEPRKGKAYGILGFAELRKENENIKLVIPGNGVDTNNLKHLVKRLNIPDVYFFPPFSDDEYKKASRTAHVVVCLSTGEEGFGRVPVQAAASGAIVVASNIDGYSEAMYGMPFVLMPEPGDVGDIARKLSFALGMSKESRKFWGQKNAAHVRKRFSWEVISSQMDTYFNDCLNRHGGVDWSKLPPSGTIYQRK